MRQTCDVIIMATPTETHSHTYLAGLVPNLDEVHWLRMSFSNSSCRTNGLRSLGHWRYWTVREALAADDLVGGVVLS